jgi:hypothetical protein
MVRAGHHLLRLEPSAAVRPCTPAREQLPHPRDVDQPGLAGGHSPPAQCHVQYGPGRGTAGLLEGHQDRKRYLLLREPLPVLPVLSSGMLCLPVW